MRATRGSPCRARSRLRARYYGFVRTRSRRVGPMSAVAPHINVCICTYRRPQLAAASAGTRLCDLETDGRFTYSIVVADNDRLESSRIAGRPPSPPRAGSRSPTAWSRGRTSRWRGTRRSSTRRGDFLAFIDDDEFPTQTMAADSVRDVPAIRGRRRARTGETALRRSRRRSGSSTAGSTSGRPTRPASSSTGERDAPATC